MRLVHAVATGILALAATNASARSATERGEARLAHMLGDRVAGPPVQCFEFVSATKVIQIEGVGVVYDTGPVIYVGRPINKLDPRDTIVGGMRRWEVCASERFYTRGRWSGLQTGIADIREFVPYTRPR